jgi:hypothetical protein
MAALIRCNESHASRNPKYSDLSDREVIVI